jgi:hypothetical protein
VVPTESQAEAVRKQLDRVLASPGFGRNGRMSRFLRFVVDRHLEGRDDELKESLIAIEVFGRKPDYDPKQDSIVRSEAARLRSWLVEYYASEGSGDRVIIELPKGGYVPVLHENPGLTPRAEIGNRARSSSRSSGSPLPVSRSLWPPRAGGGSSIETRPLPLPFCRWTT